MTQTLDSLKAAVETFSIERDWKQFHTPKNLSMALSVEASELVEIFQWLTPEQSAGLSPKLRGAVADELADTLIYLVQIANQMDIDQLDSAFEKLDKNRLKYPIEKSRGKALKYSDL